MCFGAILSWFDLCCGRGDAWRYRNAAGGRFQGVFCAAGANLAERAQHEHKPDDPANCYTRRHPFRIRYAADSCVCCTVNAAAAGIFVVSLARTEEARGQAALPEWQNAAHVHRPERLLQVRRSSARPRPVHGIMLTSMKALRRLWTLWIITAAGCASYHNERFMVVDAETSEPIPGAKVSVDYPNLFAWFPPKDAEPGLAGCPAGEQTSLARGRAFHTLVDIFFVRSLDYDNGSSSDGSTIYPGMGVGVNNDDPGIAVEAYQASGTPAPGQQRRSNYKFARTLAHEFLHYVMKVDNKGHSTKPWNLFNSGLGSPDRRDIDTSQLQKINTGVSPNAPDQ